MQQECKQGKIRFFEKIVNTCGNFDTNAEFGLGQPTGTREEMTIPRVH